MAKKEAPLNTLNDYIPKGAFPLVYEYIKKYLVHLTITKNRKSILGDYRHAHGSKNHRISINGDLNKYSFLVTLVHELAHLVTFIEAGNRVQPHGKEWKKIYALMMKTFLGTGIFPPELDLVLKNSLHNLPASSCADESITRALNKYDEKRQGYIMVEDLMDGALFSMGDNKIFKKGMQLRKRIQCLELKTGKLYLFSPVYEVQQLST
ncbi:MAG: SprT-like domain-containing protein [Chitinophagaceae bacterium]